MDYAIQIKGLGKEYPAGNLLLGKRQPVSALVDINIEIKPGEIFCLVGPNGAGKTTLLKILSTLISPSKGTAFIHGLDLILHSYRIKGLVGFVASQERSFYWRLTGRQNLRFFASLYNLRPQAVEKRINTLIDLLQIEIPDRPLVEYSTGMKQRLSIARALLHDPPILLMDEPTKSLDPWVSKNLRRSLKEEFIRGSGRSILFTTHEPNEAEDLSDRVAILNKGRIIAMGSPQEIKSMWGKDVRA